MREGTLSVFFSIALCITGCQPDKSINKIPKALNEVGDVLKLGHAFGGLISRKQEPEFEPYVSQWVELTGKTPKIGIRFTQKSEGWLRGSSNKRVGYCILYPNGQKEIRIERSQWNKVSIPKEPQSPYNLYHELILFHELGHCELGKSHNKNRVEAPDTPDLVIPQSLMHPSEDKVIPHYKKFRSFYLKNLLE